MDTPSGIEASVELPAASPGGLSAVPPRPSESEIVGLKYFDQLLPLLKRLREDGCARDRAGNRELHYDQYCLLVLLYLFNPTCSSLRALQQASGELKRGQDSLFPLGDGTAGVSSDRK